MTPTEYLGLFAYCTLALLVGVSLLVAALEEPNPRLGTRLLVSLVPTIALLVFGTPVGLLVMSVQVTLITIAVVSSLFWLLTTK